MGDLNNILLLSLLGSVISLSGGVVFLSVKSWSKVLAKYSIPFAAGVMLTVAIVGLLPEAVDLVGEQAFLFTLLSFLGAYLFEMWMFDLHHHDSDSHQHHGKNYKASVPLVIIGDTIHNFIDGVAIATSYLINPGLGLITAVSTFLHEVPHEIGDFGVLLKAGFSKKRVLLINLISALTTLVGAMVVYLLDINAETQGTLLAVAAGVFMYLGASDFLPKANRGLDKLKAVGFLLLGVGLMYGTFMMIPHSHEEEAEGHEEVTEEHVEFEVNN